MSGLFPAPPSDSRSLEILARIGEGDERGWDDLYRIYHDELLFTIRVSLGARLRAFLDSEDIFQSVALEALDALRGFEYGGEGSLRRYLKRMILNKIHDRADTENSRERAGTVLLSEAAVDGQEDPASAPTYYDADRFEPLERALNAVPEEMRHVLLLRNVEGLSSKEAAERMGKPDAATRKLYSRALARLSAILGRDAPPASSS